MEISETGLCVLVSADMRDIGYRLGHFGAYLLRYNGDKDVLNCLYWVSGRNEPWSSYVGIW